MENIDKALELNDVNGSVRISVMILYDFEDTGAFKSLQRLGIWMLISSLRPFKGMADIPPHLPGKGFHIIQTASDPE